VFDGGQIDSCDVRPSDRSKIDVTFVARPLGWWGRLRSRLAKARSPSAAPPLPNTSTGRTTTAVIKCANSLVAIAPTTNSLWARPGLAALATDGVQLYFQEGFLSYECAVGGCSNSPTQLCGRIVLHWIHRRGGTNFYFSDAHARENLMRAP